MIDMQYLRDRNYITALRRDVAASSTVHLCTVRLTRNVEYYFNDFLRRGGALYVVTNGLTRWPGSIREILDAATSLRSLGAHVAYYNSPYLLHPKLVALMPDIVYLGSHNFTGQSLGRNIERSVRIRDADLYGQVVGDIKQHGGWTK